MQRSNAETSVHIFEMQMRSVPQAVVLSRTAIETLGIELPIEACGPFLLTRDGLSQIEIP
jgi:hypothetical protein